ncbi:thioredoxin family protein [Roseovarius aestuariivivens]|uniref:thioredoxin family protein n=1 Tax=Roseovarius aestuariivivens TaxID=1888910 RepID=UPI0010809AB0|nr:thioredoxin family protein [Roseovarius aestuariivivens]
MLTRRSFCVSTVAGAMMARPGFAATMGDDGLHKQPWMLDTFLEMGDDLATASDEGRHLLVLYEQAGCPYCRELHEVNFERTEITDYIQEHFDVIQLDLWGAREVTDFDGAVLEERRLAQKWGVNFTPTTVIFGKDNVGAETFREAEVFRLPGYLKPFHYLSSLEYVVTGEYEKQSFQRYLQDKFEALREKGIDPDVW